MASSSVKPLSLQPVQSFFYFSGSLLACCGLFWVLMQLAHYFSSIVMMAGLVILFVYLLLAPVNVIHRLLQKPFLAIYARFPFKPVAPEFVAHLSRAIAIILMYLVFFLFTTVASIRFVPVTVTQLGGFLETLPTYMESVENWLGEQPWIETLLATTPEASLKLESPSSPRIAAVVSPSAELIARHTPASQASLSPKARLKENIAKTNQQLQSYLSTHIRDGLSNVLGLVGSTLTSLVYGLTALVLVFYLLLDGSKLRTGFLCLLPEEQKESANFMMLNFHRLMFAFVKSQLILGIATGLVMIVFYSIFDVPYAFFLGAFLALMEIIPVVGTWIGFAPAILVLLFMSPMKMLIIMAICYVVQTIKDNFVAPQVVGDALGLHPVVVIMALLICSQVGGLLGIVYAIPLASLLNVLIAAQRVKSEQAVL